MKASQIICILLAFGLGAGLIAALRPSGDTTEIEAKLADALSEIEALKTKQAAPSGLSNLGGGPATIGGDIADAEPNAALSALTAGGDSDAEEPKKNLTPEEQMAKLFNSPEARNLMKGFAGAMSGRADQWIGGEVSKYQEKLDLTDGQVTSITAKMAAMVKENTAKFQSQLDDDSRSMQEIMESQGDFWQQNEQEIAGMLKEELSDEQYAQFETEQLIERTQRVQRSADRELEAIDSKLELDESQEDQVFAILVQESPEFDPSMAIEGIESDLPAAATGADVDKNDAIRSVLRPDQVETFDATVESGGFIQRRRGPWGGGPR